MDIQQKESSSPLRLLVLVVIAIGVVGGLIYSTVFPGANQAATPQDSLRQQVSFYVALQQSTQKIDDLYNRLETPFVGRTSNLATLKVDQTENDKSFVENILRQELTLYGAQDVDVTAGDIEKLNDARRAFIEISFLAKSHHDAFKLMLALGNPQTGFKWNRLNLEADRRNKEVVIEGQLEVLIVDIPQT